MCAIILIVLKAQNGERKGGDEMKVTLKAARVNANMTQDEVAKKVNKSKNTIQNYESGKSIPDVEMGKKLAAIYGVTVDDIIFLPNGCA